MNRWEKYALRALVALYVLAFATFAIERHDRFNSSALDLGIQDNVLWNTRHGRPFQSAIETPHYLGDHVTLTIPLFSLLYLVREDVRIVLLAQTLFLAAGAFPLAWLAAKKLPWRWAGPAAAMAYLLYPPLGFINRYDFHPEAAVVPLLLFAFWCFEEKRTVWGYLLTLLALVSKESYGLVIGTWGLALLAFDRKHWRRGLIFSILGFGWSWFALFHVIPYFRGGPSDTLGRYKDLGETPVEILVALTAHPGRTIELLFGSLAKRQYLWRLLWPLAGLCLLCPRLLAVALPVLGYNLLSGNVSQHSIYYQYNGPAIPWLFVSAILGVSALKEGNRFPFNRISVGLRPNLARGWFFLLPFACLLAFFIHNPFKTRIEPPYFEVGGWQSVGNDAQIRKAAGLIPPSASLSTTMGLLPHFSHRQNIYLAWGGAALGADYLLFNLYDERWNTTREDYDKWLREAREKEQSRVVFFENGVLLLEHPRMRKDREASLDGYLAREAENRSATSAVALRVDPDTGTLLAFNRSGLVFNAISGNTIAAFGRPGDFTAFDVASGGGMLALGEMGKVFTRGSVEFSGDPRRLQRIFTDLEATPDGKGYYVLDCFGRVHAFGSTRHRGDDFGRENAGVATDLALTPDGSGYAILWSFGLVATFGNLSLPGNYQPFGWDIARAIRVTGNDSGYLLDGFGGIHSLGGAPRWVYPGYTTTDHLADLAIDREGRMWVMDHEGNVHPAQRAGE